jgi:hypothetical protein
LELNTIPEAGKNDSSGFTQTCRDVNQLGATGSASTQRIVIFQAGVRPAGEPALIRIGLQGAGCGTEDFVKSRITHRTQTNLFTGFPFPCLVKNYGNYAKDPLSDNGSWPVVV